MLKQKRRQDYADSSPVDDDYEPAEHEMPDEQHGFSIQLKKKRRTAMLKHMLSDAGYDDLAKMINIKEY